MGRLGGQLAILKVKDGEEGERFQIRFEDPAKALKPGYMWSDSGVMTEDELRDALTTVGATLADLARILAEARANYKP